MKQDNCEACGLPIVTALDSEGRRLHLHPEPSSSYVVQLRRIGDGESVVRRRTAWKVHECVREPSKRVRLTVV